MAHFDSEEQISNEKQHSKNVKRNFNAADLKNQRITRRMKKIIENSIPFSQTQQDQKCAICLNLCGKSSATLPCSHRFCMGCLGNWWVTNSTCPYCRKPFEYILDYRGRKLKQSQIPQNLLIKREQTLKCESCWADIAEEPMRICYNCRCVYLHKRCLTQDQLKITRWKCQQCIQAEQHEIDKIENVRQKREKQYKPTHNSYQRMTPKLSSRHTPRLAFTQAHQKIY